MAGIRHIAETARSASRFMATLDHDHKNNALLAIAQALSSHAAEIFLANRQDLERAETEGLAAPLLKRLAFDENKLRDVVEGLGHLAEMPDPVGRTQLATRLDEGLDLYRVSCPLGVIGIIFESRPDALVQISSLALKSGNAVMLKGGSEAALTNAVLTKIILAAGQEAGLPDGWIHLMESRADVADLLSMDDLVDLVIPRGSNEFVRYIMDHTQIPVLGHADGVCHLYVDDQADPDMAIRLAVDSKTQYVAVCNAAETILLHEAIAESLLPELAQALRGHQVTLYGCERTRALTGCLPVQDWHHEYLDYAVSIRIVDQLEAAIDHINQFGSGHTDAIVSQNPDAARRFLLGVDSGNVFWNASTRFSDGFKYGFGAEVGVSTSKIHARGPVGIEGLLTYQYRIIGQGQTVDEYASGKKQFHHRPIDQNYPL